MTVLDNWKEILAISAPFLTFFAGRKATKLLEKRQHVDAVEIMQKTYDTFLLHYEKQYDEVSKRLTLLQNQFAELTLSYAKEVEISQNWQKLHSELEKQHQILNKKYDVLLKQYEDSDRKHKELMTLYEKLKADFEKYKKQH